MQTPECGRTRARDADPAAQLIAGNLRTADGIGHVSLLVYSCIGEQFGSSGVTAPVRLVDAYAPPGP